MKPTHDDGRFIGVVMLTPPIEVQVFEAVVLALTRTWVVMAIHLRLYCIPLTNPEKRMGEGVAVVEV